MSSVKSDSFLGGFAIGIRTLHISVRNLSMTRGWTAYGLLSAPEDPPRPPHVAEAVGGTAVLVKDSLAVVGSETPPTRRLSFGLHSFDNWDALTEAWKNRRDEWGDPLHWVEDDAKSGGDERQLKFLRHVYEDFERRPPTVGIGFRKADWEIGTSDEWQLDCSVPRPILAALIDDMRRGSVRRLELAITLAPTLVSEEHAPPSVPITLGILRMGKYSSGEGRGWVENIGWRVASTERISSRTEASGRSASVEPTADDNPPAPVEGSPSSQVVTSLLVETARLSQTIRGGFILLFILLLVMAIFVR